MSMFPCSVHGKRTAGKLASVYYRWFTPDGKSVGWKQRLCPDCARETLKPLIAHANDESLDVSVCPVCGSDSSKDMVPMYTTICTPGSDPRELELPICEGCAPAAQLNAMQGAERLPDRGQSRGAMAPREPQDPFGDLWS